MCAFYTGLAGLRECPFLFIALEVVERWRSFEWNRGTEMDEGTASNVAGTFASASATFDILIPPPHSIFGSFFPFSTDLFTIHPHLNSLHHRAALTLRKSTITPRTSSCRLVTSPRGRALRYPRTSRFSKFLSAGESDISSPPVRATFLPRGLELARNIRN